MSNVNNFISILEKSFDDYEQEKRSSIVSAYLTRIDAPEDLKHIDHVAKEMEKIIEVLKKVRDKGEEELFENWEKINKEIGEYAKKTVNGDVKFLYSVSSESKKNGKETEASLHGKITKHPLYALLWHIENKKENSKQYEMLKSVMFRIWPGLSSKTSEDYIRKCSTQVRILGEEHKKDILKLLPSKPQTVKDYLKSITKLLEDKKSPLVSNEVHEIARSIRFALGINDFGTHDHTGGLGGLGGGKARGVRPSMQSLEFIDYVEDELDEEFKGIGVYRLNSLKAGGFRSDDYDLTTDDLNDEFDILELIPRAEDYLDLDPKLEALRVKGMKNSMAMSGQFLPSHRSEMSLWEIGNIFKYLDEKLENPDENRHELEVVIILALTFFYGRAIEDICELTIHTNPPSKAKKGGLSFIRNTKCIQISIDGPTYRTTLDSNKEAEAIIVDRTILLACPPLLADAIELHAESVRPDKKRSGYKVFLGLDKEYKKEIDKLVRNITKSKMTSVSMRKRIFNKILYESSDVTDAIMVTNQRYGMPESRLHYTTRKKETLTHIHATVVHNLIKEIYDEFEYLRSDIGRWIEGPLPDQSGYVGARLTPRREAVQKLVHELKDKISLFRGDDDIKFHNAYTAYCVLMLDYATASRAVARKYFLESDMDLDSNLMLAWDKNAGDSINSRVAYLPDVCINQIKAYRKHREIIIKRIAGLPASKSDALKNSENQNPKSYFKHSLRKHVDSGFGQFFFLDNKGSPQQLHPKRIREQLEEIFHLPPNVNRHNFRFYMCTENILGEIMDAYLGHSIWGEEAYGRFSTLSLTEVIDQVKPQIEKIMIQDGWSVERGLVR